MFLWCAFLFILGISAFMDTIYNYGNIFRQINSVLFMLISLGLLVRTTTKMRERKQEKYEERISTLEMNLRTLQGEKEKEKEMSQF